jgi:hypothetical protein
MRLGGKIEPQEIMRRRTFLAFAACSAKVASSTNDGGSVEKKEDIACNITVSKFDWMGAKWIAIFKISSQSDKPVDVWYDSIYDPYRNFRITDKASGVLLPNNAGGLLKPKGKKRTLTISSETPIACVVPLMSNDVFLRDTLESLQISHIEGWPISIS